MFIHRRRHSNEYDSKTNIMVKRIAVCSLFLVVWGNLDPTSVPVTVSALTSCSFHGSTFPLRQGLARIGRRTKFPGTTTTITRTSMVFDAPSAEVMEQISTQDLIDRILDESLRTSARRPIMIQFDPSRKAIWRHWKGTVFSETWRSSVKHTVWAALVYLLFAQYPKVQQSFAGFSIIWAQILGVTTFTLTFFVNQSYAIWNRILSTCRDLQGRLNDFLLSTAGYAQRTDDTGYSSTSLGTTALRRRTPSEFTPASHKLLLVQARYVRLFTILLYASLTRSHRPLLTPLGLRRMVARGLLTEDERSILKQAAVPANTRHNVVLMWMFRTFVQASKTSVISGGAGFEQMCIQRVQEIRGFANSMESVLKGRMPFAYAHVVQVLVDVTLWLYPFMIFSSGINLYVGFFGTLVLTSCYQGLFDLAKQFLDPFHNENFWKGNDALVVDTLIAETNSNSVRWMNCLADMPIATRDIEVGQLDNHILPEDGYTVEEAAEMEMQRKLAQEVETKSATPSTRMTEESTPTLTASSSRTAAEEAVHEMEKEQEEELARLEEAESELEETVAILNAQPGLDFVPGLDDEGESLLYHKSYGTNSTKTIEVDDNDELAEQFYEATDEQLKEVQELIEDADTTPPFS